MKNLELLAPAGNLENFYTAIANGADAVYLGLLDFNARANIENFSLETLSEVINYAHLFGVKVYITLNTLIRNDEMNDVLLNVEKLLKFGVDAFIVQDLGLAYCIKKMFPNAVLHASTQMGICNLEGAQIVKSLGFSRVVLARETPLSEIERIHKNCDIEIEYFVQGALCVSFSGNCYISALNSGASGNRGKCKQFCRLPYVLSDGKQTKEGYLLSAKDFCMLDKLEDMAKAGVVSFKIEGRARRAGYVAQAVSVYREALNKLCENRRYDTKQDKEKLKLAFNRGDFVSGYFGNEKLIDSNVQGHRGVKIGKVLNVNFGKRFNCIKLTSSKKLSSGDGLKFLFNEREIASVGLNDVKEIAKNTYEITTTANVKKGCDVFLTLDSQNEQKLLKTQRKLPVFASFTAKIGQRATLSLSCGEVEIFAESETVCQQAKNCPLSRQEVELQLKTNDVFDISVADICLEEVFLRKAELNEIRRNAIENLKQKLIENYNQNNIAEFVKNEYKLNQIDKKMPQKAIYLFNNASQIERFDNKSDKFVYCPDVFDFEKISEICQQFSDSEIYLNLPIFATFADIKIIKQILAKNKNLNIYANNYYAFNLDNSKKVIASNNLNVYNSFSILALKEMNVEDIVVSVECDEKIANNATNLYQFSNFKPTYMNVLHCPFKEHFASDCKNCKYRDGFFYKMQNGKKMQLFRTKVATCNFQLVCCEKNFKDLNYNPATTLFN